MFCGLKPMQGGAGEAFVVAPGGDRPPVAVSDELAAFLVRCGKMKTLEEHLHGRSRYREDMACLADECRRKLPELEQAGVVVSEVMVLEKLTVKNAVQRAALRTVVVPSAGRTECARRLVESILRGGERFGRRLRVLLADDSRRREGEEIYRQMAAEFRVRGDEVVHLGSEEKARLRRELAGRSGVEPALVDFALADPLGTGFTCGANRNWCLLATAGLPVWSVDDDLAGPPRLHQDRIAGWRVGGDQAAAPHVFYPGGLPVSGGERWDWLGEAERWLGRRVEVWPGEAADFGGLEGEAGQAFVEGRAWVPAVFTGFRGRPLVTQLHYWLQLGGASLRGLAEVGDPEIFAADPWMELCPPCATLSRRSTFPGLSMGLDNTRVLFPFFPAFHAEDAVMGMVLAAAWPEAWCVQLPGVVVHDPPGWSAGSLAAGAREALVEECFMLTRLWVTEAGRHLDQRSTPEERAAGLGKFLALIGEMAEEEFAAKCEEMADVLAGEQARRLAQVPQIFGANHRLAALAEAHLNHLEGLGARDDFWVPGDVQRVFGAGAAQVFQKMLADYGRLILAWPALWGAARDWREEAGMEVPGWPGGGGR